MVKKYYLRLVVIAMVAKSCVLMSPISYASEKIVYYGAFHDNKVYHYYPDYFTFKVLSEEEAANRKVHFRVEPYGYGMRKVSVMRNNEATSYRLIDENGIVLEYAGGGQETCIFVNEISEKVRLQKCHRDGQLVAYTRLYYVMGHMAKREYLNEKGEVEKYSLLDHIDHKEYFFSASGKFLERKNLPRAGQ